MIQPPNRKRTARALPPKAPSSARAPSVAIFTLPKPFTNPHINLIQRNAISSWKALGSQVETVLLGSDSGIEETAKEFGAKYAGEVKCNEHGTPLIGDAFQLASQLSDADVLVYCNCDVMLFPDLCQTLEIICNDDRMTDFVAFGRRTNLCVLKEINFEDEHHLNDLMHNASLHGVKAPVVCKEYFAFTRGLFANVPDFAVGRGNWDNWMIANTKAQNIPVVNVSDSVTAIHQEHNYAHLNTSRLNCYVSGQEARENQKLAGGKNVIGGSTGTWRVGCDGLQKIRGSWLNTSFWLDFHRFARMVARLPFQR